MTKLSEAQDAFFAAFAEMSELDRNHLLNAIEMDVCQGLASYIRPKANVVLNALDALSQAISEEQ
jgi:hypothetical protein